MDDFREIVFEMLNARIEPILTEIDIPGGNQGRLDDVVELKV